MKNFTKLLFCTLSLLSATAAFATHKQQIRLSNQYGKDVLVHLDWRMKNWPHTHRPTDLILKSTRNNFLLKAPISGYELYSLDATPSINLAALTVAAPAIIGAGALAAGAASVSGGVAIPAIIAASNAPYIAATADSAYEITHSLNSHKIKVHSHKHFVIKAEKQNSKVVGQKQITIHGYTEAEFNKEIGNSEVVEVEIVASPEINGNEIDDNSQAQANLDKLVNAMR